jgi:hypothetical protein
VCAALYMLTSRVPVIGGRVLVAVCFLCVAILAALWLRRMRRLPDRWRVGYDTHPATMLIRGHIVHRVIGPCAQPNAHTGSLGTLWLVWLIGAWHGLRRWRWPLCEAQRRACATWGKRAALYTLACHARVCIPTVALYDALRGWVHSA